MDKGWPVLGARPEKDEVPIASCAPASPGMRQGTAANGIERPIHACLCGATEAPSLNTGFVYARPRPAVISLFSSVVETILSRLREPLPPLPNSQLPWQLANDAKELNALWAQAVVNEVVRNMSQLWSKSGAPNSARAGEGGAVLLQGDPSRPF